DQEIGIDKGYTEAFYTSNGDSIADGVGHLMTEKTKRITRTNRNRYRLVPVRNVIGKTRPYNHAPPLPCCLNSS
ncbi:MAG: hypothetical protein RIM23_17470, partial [Coleofasciculus sp. G3-WIS-01]